MRTGHAPAVPPWLASRRHRITVAIIVLVLTGLIVWGVTWWRHADVLGLDGAGIDPVGVPLADAAYALNLADPIRSDGSETITLKSAEVHFKTNTAGVKATMSICTGRAGVDQIGAVKASDVAKYCSRVVPIRDGTKMVCTGGDRPKQYVILTLIATKVGFTRADSVRIDYQRSWDHLYQRGSLNGDLDVGIRVTK